MHACQASFANGSTTCPIGGLSLSSAYLACCSKHKPCCLQYFNFADRCRCYDLVVRVGLRAHAARSFAFSRGRENSFPGRPGRAGPPRRFRAIPLSLWPKSLSVVDSEHWLVITCNNPKPRSSVINHVTDCETEESKSHVTVSLSLRGHMRGKVAAD
jgi:hypothetical protein